MRRRDLLAGVASLALASPLLAARAEARPRIAYGGRLALHAPWPLGAIDPHRVDDATAAYFGEALYDPLYAPDGSGALVPSLAEDDPEPDGATLRVTLRAGVRFASGAPVDARAVVGAIARARARDASAWLAEIPAPRIDRGALVFAMRDARRLVRALASPLAAIVPPRFTPDRPDGTGPFRATMQGGTMRLVRNMLAANGPSFLDAIEIQPAPDLATSLRAFESGADDLGWLGSFLHDPRPDAKSFDAGFVAWAILRTGRDAGTLDAPGTAQSLADGVPHAALASFVVGPPWAPTRSAWTGGPADLLVRSDAPWLVELARALAAALSSPSHELRCAPLPASEIASRRTARGFTLMLDVARPAGPGPLGAILGLATADDAATAVALSRHPPRGEPAARAATRAMRLGVVGEIRLQGGRAPDVVLPASPWGRGIDWGLAFQERRP